MLYILLGSLGPEHNAGFFEQLDINLLLPFFTDAETSVFALRLLLVKAIDGPILVEADDQEFVTSTIVPLIEDSDYATRLAAFHFLVVWSSMMTAEEWE
jgi:hypothetical protein